jgi:hypothetical protein
MVSGRHVEAEKSLRWLRGAGVDITTEMEALKKSMESTIGNGSDR